MKSLALRPRLRPGAPAAIAATLSILLAALFLHAPAAHATPLDGNWVEYDPPGPLAIFDGRTSFAMILDTARDRMLVFGGVPGLKNDVWVFPLAPGLPLTHLAPLGTLPPPRYGAAAIYDALNDRMVVFGGYTNGPGTPHTLNDVWELSLSGTPTWTQLFPAGTAPAPRLDAGAVYDPSGQRMIVCGGYKDPGVFTNEVWSLSLTGAPTWVQLSPTGTPPSPRSMFGFAYDASRDRMVIFGGWNGAYLGDSWELDLSGNGAWASIPTATWPHERRQCYAAYDDAGDRFVIFGGTYGPRRGDVWALDFSGTPDWTVLSQAVAAPNSRYGGSAIYDPLRNRLVICGGSDPAARIDVHAFALGGPPVWTRLHGDSPSTSSHPLFRRDYVLALDPATSDLFMFGGIVVNDLNPSAFESNALHRLSLASLPLHWQPVVAAGTLPTPRHAHAAVWDPIRHRMLTFGGYNTSYLNDLWEMNPYPTPSWQQLTTSGTPPEGRSLCGMVFDPVHDRLVIVGGNSGSAMFRNDVWELPLSGPNAMTWTPLSPSGTPPAARWIYDMTYDPPRHRALLFGGMTHDYASNDVWALELGGAPAWSPVMPTGPAPSSRSGHSMIYDPVNDRMVVFAGFLGFGEYGVRNHEAWALTLSPFPQWSMLHPTGGPPVARDMIHAVYDPLGARLVAYGGYDGSLMLTDTWALEWEPGVVPIAASLVESHAEPGLVRLSWFVADAASAIASVERRVGASAWASLGAPARTATNRLSFEDRDVLAGTRYAYRLRLRASGEETLTDAVEIEVPSGYVLELAGAQPNPAIGERLMVAFTLPSRGTARLDLLDLSGRRVASRDVSALGAGRHRVELGDGTRLAPGVYVVRLEAGERALSKKAFVIR